MIRLLRIAATAAAATLLRALPALKPLAKRLLDINYKSNEERCNLS